MNHLDLHSERLICRPLSESLIEPYLEYCLRNLDYLAPWEPTRAENFYSPVPFHTWCQLQIESIAKQQSLRFMIALRDSPTQVIGVINYTALSPTPALSCNLGYSIDQHAQGKGLITEALTASNAYLFDSLKLHRIAASYMPRNKASAAVLRKLGFSVEGYARSYLQIAGQWEDHVLTALVNEP